MDLGHLYTSFDGRINRQPYWIGTIILIVVTLLITFVVGKLLGVSITAPDFRFKLVALVMAVPVALPCGGADGETPARPRPARVACRDLPGAGPDQECYRPDRNDWQPVESEHARLPAGRHHAHRRHLDLCRAWLPARQRRNEPARPRPSRRLLRLTLPVHARSTRAMSAESIVLAQNLVHCASVTPADGGALGVLEGVLKGVGFATHRVVYGYLKCFVSLRFSVPPPRSHAVRTAPKDLKHAMPVRNSARPRVCWAA
jgi:hypothetical protein